MLRTLGLILFAFSLTVSASPQEERVLKDLLANGYNPSIRPGVRPVNVTVDMFIRNIRELDIFTGEMEFQVTFRQTWVDSRLRYRDGPSYLTVIQKEKLWTPDTFFRNELEASEHSVLVPNEYLRIFPDGKVLYSLRLTLRTVCDMDLRQFPFDSQTCPIQIASYAWAVQDIVYNWKESDPIQVSGRQNLREYRMADFTKGTCNVKTSTGEYSCIKASLEFERKSSTIVLTLYIPIMMFVVLAGLASLIPINGSLALRLIIILSCLICSSAYSAYANASIAPRVAYTKAIDIWTGTSICFIFMILAETIIMAALGKSDKEFDDYCGNTLVEKITSGPKAMRCDLICRLLYVFLVVAFCVIYFATYA